MNNYSDKNYTDFFKEEVYGRFSNYLVAEYGANKVNLLLKGEMLMTKKGVHSTFQRDFTKFLSLNPKITKEFAKNRNRFMRLRNIEGGDLMFMIDPSDEELMVREAIRVPGVVPIHHEHFNSVKQMKDSAGPMTGQVINGPNHERKYRLPKRLTVHFKEGYSNKIGKTTLSFKVRSRGEALGIILDRFEKRVAYASIQGEEEFCFVKPRNGKDKRNRKLRS